MHKNLILLMSFIDTQFYNKRAETVKIMSIKERKSSPVERRNR